MYGKKKRENDQGKNSGEKWKVELRKNGCKRALVIGTNFLRKEKKDGEQWK